MNLTDNTSLKFFSPHLIMPMCGNGSRFTKKGYLTPKPLIEIHNRPFFYWAVRSIQKYIPIKTLTFLTLKQHILEFNLDERIHEYFPNASIVALPKTPAGPTNTCLEGIKKISDASPIIFNDCDHLFYSSQLISALTSPIYFDGGLLSFKSKNPQYSYI